MLVPVSYEKTAQLMICSDVAEKGIESVFVESGDNIVIAAGAPAGGEAAHENETSRLPCLLSR